MSSANQGPLSGIVEKLIRDLKNRAKNPTNRVVAFWPRIVELEIQEHTKPLSLRNGRLLVAVDDSNWLFELTHRYKKALLAKLQAEFGSEKVQDIRFVFSGH